MKTHLCLVSAQPTPNLTPVLDPATRPRQVVLLVSRDMEKRAAWLAQVIEQKGVTVDHWPIDDPFDIEHVQQRVLELLDRLGEPLEEKSVALNATGGTKPMSIAAYEVFRLYELPIFYVHPERDRIVWLYPGEWENRDLENRIRLEAFLAAHGAAVEGQPGRNVPDRALLEVGRQIVEKIGGLQTALGRLNFLAAKAQRNLQATLSSNERASVHELVSLFASQGFLSRRKNTIRFRDEASRFFVNGGWLEYYVFDAVRRLRKNDPDIHDVARSIDIRREVRGKSVPNEIDVAFLRDNRLHLIECKTARLGGEGDDSPGAEVLYKLDSLADLVGGLKARAMLVSFRNIKKHDRRRAESLGIRLCAGEELQNLTGHLRQLVK